jgi:protein-S-isoprenylcysteine O-methyltransferase Ste14
MAAKVPALIVGLIIGAYWARVLYMARKWRQRAGHSANFIPAERVGKLTRFVWIPVVVLWVALPIIRGLGQTRPLVLEPLISSSLLSWPAALVALAAYLATLVCWKKMGKSWRMGIDPNETTQLIVTGPYGHVRHPIYALSMVLMFATMVVCPTPLMLIVGPIHIVLLYFEARREELYLKRVHGAMYEEYCQQVSRFIPCRGIDKTKPLTAENKWTT